MRVALLLASLLVACSGAVAPPDSGAPVDAAVQVDAGAGASCGDGVVGAGEACDGAPRACTELGGSWTAGEAACRADCRGWDPSACVRRPSATWEIVKPAEREPARWAGALCNDGTPFGFAIRLAPTPSSDWVIHLQGGVYCDDATLSCADRLRDTAHYTTTPPQPDGSTGALPLGGIFSSDPSLNPDFLSANEVHAYYCSSDFWSGQDSERRPTIAAPGGWYFAGRANVAAMVEILVERYGLQDDPQARVLWGGSSAGSFGARFNLARIRDAVPQAFAAQRVLYFGDAPWMMDFDDPTHRIESSTLPDREVWRAALAFWGGALDSDCLPTVDDPIDCWFGPTWYPIVRAQMPVLVQQSDIDGSFGYALHGFTTCDEMGQCSDPGDQSSLDAWTARIRTEMAVADRLFSGHVRYHTLALADDGLAMGPPGSTLREVLGRYWNGGAPERVTF